MTLCGITPDCEPVVLTFTQQPEDALIREYCDNTQFFPPGEGFDTVCGTCLNEQQEDEKQYTEFTAVATNGAGEGLNVPLSFSLQASDDLSNWDTIESLPNGSSGEEQSLSALLDDWDGNSVNTTDCHKWLSGDEAFDQVGQTLFGSVFEGFFSDAGYSVDISDWGVVPRIVVGYPTFEETSASVNNGVAVLQKSGDEFIQIGENLIPRDLESVSASAGGEKVAISQDGNTIAWTYRRNHGAGGKLVVSEWNGISWVSVLVASNLMVTDAGVPVHNYSVPNFDMKMSGDGNTIIFGVGNDSNLGSTGVFRIYRKVNGTWTLFATDQLDPVYGAGVAINYDGSVFALSGYEEIENNQPGSVKVFSLSSTGSISQIGNTIGNPELNPIRLGPFIDLNSDGNRIAIGGYNTSSQPQPVYSYVFEIDLDAPTTWNQLGQSIPSDDLWRQSVVRIDNGDGNHLVIGQPTTGGGDLCGSVKVYKYYQVSDTWELLTGDILPKPECIDSPGRLDARTGWSVAISPVTESEGDDVVVAVGAPEDYKLDNDNRPGAARVYSLDGLQSSCDKYQETIIGSCRKRVWSRRFRIKAHTENGLVAYSDPFQIYQWYGPNDVDPPNPDGGRWLGGDEIPAGYVGSLTENTLYSRIGFQDFNDAKGLNYLPQSNSPPLLTGALWNYRTGHIVGGIGGARGLVWIFDGGDGGVNDNWEQLTGLGDGNGLDDGYATESSIWASEFARGTIVDVAGNRAPSVNQIVAVQAGEALPRVELFDKYLEPNGANSPTLDTVDHISQIENVAEGIAGSDSFSLVASPFVLKTDPSLDNVLSDKLHIFAHVIKGTNLLQFYAQSPNTKKFIRVQLETGFDDWPLLFDRSSSDTLGNISIHARPIVIQNGDGTYGGHTSVHVAYSIKQNNVTKMFVQRWKMEYFATDSLGFGGPIDEGFVIFREEDPEIPDSTERGDGVALYDNREFITSYSLQPVVVKFSKEWSQPAILVAFGRSNGNPDGDNINVYRWDNQSGLGIQNYRLGDWTKRQEITGRSIVEQFEPSLDPIYKWQFPIGANKLAMTDLSMDGNVIAFPYQDYNDYPTTEPAPQGDPAVVMEWNGSEYIKKGNILYDWKTVIGTYKTSTMLTSNYGGLSLNNNGQAIILTTRLESIPRQEFSPFSNALSTYRWLPE
tara:strand:+ start:49 stop:3549 length:3501 start_codon:yes stop_codon:yes gene_type:complete